jgi:hypothetical protein
MTCARVLIVSPLNILESCNQVLLLSSVSSHVVSPMQETIVHSSGEKLLRNGFALKVRHEYPHFQKSKNIHLFFL